MSAAAFRATIHGLKTVPTRKVCQLTVEFPIEQLAQVAQIADHGAWVAIARLNEVPAPSTTGGASSDGRAAPATERGRLIHNNQGEEKAQLSEQPPQPAAEKSAGADKPKSPAQIAGYLCTLPTFQRFLQERFTDEWTRNSQRDSSGYAPPADIARECIYDICTVTSRTQLTKDNMEWNALRLAFQLWEQHPELEDA
jgi:hypothetical protein